MSVECCDLPDNALLRRYQHGDEHHYTDCFWVEVDGAVALGEFMRFTPAGCSALND